jgi:hypothetical protein
VEKSSTNRLSWCGEVLGGTGRPDELEQFFMFLWNKRIGVATYARVDILLGGKLNIHLALPIRFWMLIFAA